MEISFHEVVVPRGRDLPLGRRRLVPEDHDGSLMVDLDGLPLNTPTATLREIDHVRSAGVL